MKTLLLLGGSRYLLPVIREAKALGCRVITCDYLPDNIAHRYSDEYANVSIVDREAVLALARERKIDGVMSFACDPGVVTAAYVAEQLGLGDLPTLLLQVPLGVLIYVLGSVLFKVESFRFLWELVKNYRNRKGAQA